MRSSKTVGENLVSEGVKKKPGLSTSSGTAKKPSGRVASAPRPGKKGAPAASAAAAPQMPDHGTIERMVAEAAYYLAEKRAFAPGFEEQDWQAAKDQITAELRSVRNPLG